MSDFRKVRDWNANDIVVGVYMLEDHVNVTAVGTALRRLRQGSKLYTLISDIAQGSPIRAHRMAKSICRKYPRDVVEELFANRLFNTILEVGDLESYLETDGSG